MSDIKVSVIVPVYNAESIIQGTMKMLGSSLLKDIEIIAVNDGSSDKSLQVLKQCAKEDPRIKVIDKENGGIFDARNHGLQEATGEYICFCDQDDFVDSRMYQRMYQTAKEKECDLVICSTGELLAKDQKVPTCLLKDATYEGNDVISQCFIPVVLNRTKLKSGLQKITTTIWKCMISRCLTVDNNLKFRRYVGHEDDWLFLLDVLARAGKVALLSDVLYYWKVDLNSESHKPQYIDNLYPKCLDLIDAITEIMKTAGCNVADIKFFVNTYSAFCYAWIVINEINHTNCKNKDQFGIISRIYDDNNFKEKVKAEKYLSNNLFARKIICHFLKYKHTVLAYYFYKLYLFIRGNNQNKSFWIKAENKIKNNG